MTLLEILFLIFVLLSALLLGDYSFKGIKKAWTKLIKWLIKKYHTE